jgi:hypothetical protein
MPLSGDRANPEERLSASNRFEIFSRASKISVHQKRHSFGPSWNGRGRPLSYIVGQRWQLIKFRNVLFGVFLGIEKLQWIALSAQP